MSQKCQHPGRESEITDGKVDSMSIGSLLKGVLRMLHHYLCYFVANALFVASGCIEVAGVAGAGSRARNSF